MDSVRPCKILISSLDAHGHANTCLGLGAILAERGNEVYFLNRSMYKEATEKQGIKFLDIEDYEAKNDGSKRNRGNALASNFEKIDIEQCQSPLDWVLTAEKGEKSVISTMIEEIREFEKVIEKVIQKMDFDVVLGDFIFRMPFFTRCPIPFVPIMSINPIGLYNGPPQSSGLSVNDDPENWKKAALESAKDAGKFIGDIVSWYQEAGLSITNDINLFPSTEYLGIYVYPEALDYKELGPRVKPNWVRMECSIRKLATSDFEIPESLQDKPGKLIFFSLGSLGSSNLKLMKLLVETLSKSPHRFIVSKGSQGDQFDLPDNMWGQNFVNQLAILPKVDLVITHGGNNTLVETLAAGKPMIVMPVFGDQLDNAQRIQDLGLGKRIDPIGFEEDNLLQSIEDLLADKTVKQKIADISHRLKNSDSGAKVAEYIEKLARARVSPLEENL